MSLEKLEADVHALKESMEILHGAVLDQKLDQIEDFIVESKTKVEEAAPVIQEAASYSSYLYYIAASVGTAVFVLVFL